jgi:hypothetical protein
MYGIRNPYLRRLKVCMPLLAAMAALGTGTAHAAPAMAAQAVRVAPAAHEVRTVAAVFAGQASLKSVSCHGASWCMAVGSYTTTDQVRHSLAMIWTGASWRLLRNPPGRSLAWVSCSSPTFCMASGGPTGAERWNGKAWRTMPSPNGGVFGVSCASHTLCMMIHNKFVRSWNGTTWHAWRKQTDIFCGGPSGPCGLARVSCGSTTNCVAVGTWTVSQEPVQNAVAVMWNGKSWSVDDDLPASGNPAAMNAVSCAGSFCMAGGGAFIDVDNGGVAIADTWDAATRSWTGVPIDLGTLCSGFQTCSWPSAIACASRTSCMTLGPPGSQFWNGSSWKPARTISAGRGSELQGVSCGGADCLAVGFRTVAGKKRTLAELWNGSAWTILRTPK